jgi:polysaccharide pyruvyl transferase WcaK-like protein
MAGFTEYLIVQMNATIIFIPHVMEQNNDDREVGHDVIEHLTRKENVRLINTEYTAAETKGIIAWCDILVTARMHPAIHAASVGVPFIVIAYSQKVHGIFGEMLNMSEQVVDIRNLTLPDLIKKMEYVYENKDKIQNELKKMHGILEEKARLNAKLTVDLLNQ